MYCLFEYTNDNNYTLQINPGILAYLFLLFSAIDKIDNLTCGDYHEAH